MSTISLLRIFLVVTTVIQLIAMLITLYYQWTPAIIEAMEQDEAFKEEVKEIIDAVLPIIRLGGN